MKRKMIAAALLGAASLYAKAAGAECSLGMLLEMPVTMVGLKPHVTIKLDGRETRFIADSGGFYSMISPGSAAELGLKLQDAPPGFLVSGIGGDQNVRLTTVKTLGLGKFNLSNVEFIVGGSEFGSVGLLGQNVLGLADVEYDLGGGTIRLMRSHGCSRANLAYWTKPGEIYSVLPIDPQPDNPLMRRTTGTIIVNGAKINAMFDTGAGISMMTLTAARRAGIRADGAGVVAAGMTSGIGKRYVRTWIAPVADLKIGDEEIKNTHVRVGDLPNANYDMLVGADFFLSHHVYVSNANQKMYFTYKGGPVFDLSIGREGGASGPDVIAGDGKEPVDAEGFGRRASAFLARGETDRALADLDRAIGLAPNEPRYLVQRARAHLLRRQLEPALADLDAALKLKADDPEALLTRAALRLGKKDKAGARADVDAASRAASAAADIRLDLGSMYDSLDDFGAALAEYDKWLKVHTQDKRQPLALNDRCWARAMLGRELPLAIADCNAALRQRPHTAEYLDSLGLALLRAGRTDAAIAAYNEALTLDSRLPWSLYGRGLARLRKGDKAAGDADIKAATTQQPDLADRATKLGITS